MPENTTATPDLLQHLMEKFQEKLTAADGCKKADQQLIESIRPFLDFCSTYLNDNRVVQNFAADANHGVVLSDNTRCMICPEVNLSGTMQDSAAIGISSGQGQPGQEGVVPVSDAQKVI